MAQSYEFLPDGDIENDGWTIVGGSATSVWEVLRYYYDDCYVRCPVYRGGAEVKFPFDYSDQFPEGAIIDSITVKIRMRTASGSGARGVTVNMLSADNRSRYTTRTVWATNSLPDDGVEVGTYSKDPLGRPWDIHRLNKLRLRIFSQNNLADSVRIYGLWVVVNFHTKPSVTVTSPSGTVSTPSPTVSWQYSQYEAEPQKSAEYKIFTLQAASASTFNPETADAIYATTVNGIANSFVLPTSLNNNDYKVYVRATSQYGAKSSWASKQFTVTAPAPGVPGDNNAGLSGVPGIGTPTVVPDNYTSSAAIRMTDTSNLLSVQQADFEIPSDPLGYTGSNATLARDTAHAFADGIASMKITADSAGDALAVSNPIEIHPGLPMTLRGQILADDTARTVKLTARFYDETWALLPDVIEGSITDSDETWIEATATGTAPASAKYCEVVATVEGAAEDEAHFIDHVGLMYGTDTAWSDGGHVSRNMLSSFLATGDDPASATDAWTQANSATTVARVATSGTGAHGAKCNRMTYVGVSPSIGFRAAGTSGTGTLFNSSTSGNDFTLYKPTSPNAVQDNDLLIAFVTSNEHGTINPPTGWTAVNTASIDDGSTDTALWILKRTGLASDPSSWTTGTVSATSTRRTAVVVAYSGAAHADEQFIADAVRTDASGALTHRTAEVVNTDPNAWRISAFAANDNVTGGAFQANTSPPNVSSSSISYVGRATAWKSTSRNTSYTVNKPSGVKAGDLMIAAALFSGSPATVNVPGVDWVEIRKEPKIVGNGDDHSGSTTLVIWKKVAGSSEPNSWTATHSSGPQPKITQCVAYRGCDPNLIDDAVATKASSSSLSTGTVTNTNSKAWRITLFSAATNYANWWNTGDVVERTDDSTSLSGHPDTVLAFNDSNGMVGTGSHSRTANFGNGSFFSGIGWIGLLAPATSLVPAGPNESERVDYNPASSNPWMTTAVYDSGGVVGATGKTSVYGSFTSSDGSASSMVSWIGLIKPAASSEGGEAAAAPDDPVDVGQIDEEVFRLAGRKLTMMADFKGSTAGTPTLTAEFYRANQLIAKRSATGRPFDTGGFTKSWAVFDIPEGTTRIRPVLSALDREIGDTVDFDRVAVMFGSLSDPTAEPQWRNGTARPEHPIWSKPVIEYQENDGTGWSEWTLLPGQRTLPPQYDLNTASMFYVDHTVVPIYSRRYRVSTTSYGLNGDVFSSGFGPASQEAIFESRTWWLKDLQDLSRNMQVSVKWKDQQVDTTNMATSFQPIGEEFPVVVSEGLKGDSFSLEIHCESAEFTALLELLNSGRTLILQSDIDRMWWVRPVGNISAQVLATSSRQERPRRYVTVNFAQVAPED